MTYDELGTAYERHTASSATNAYYDRPAILALAGAVQDKDVLDVGCAAGHLTAELAARGARVTGVDVSPVMVNLARRRCGDRAILRCADIAQPLDFLTDDSV